MWSLIGHWKEFGSSLSEMSSDLQLSGQWNAGGARAGVKHHLGGYAIINHHVGLKSDQSIFPSQH